MIEVTVPQNGEQLVSGFTEDVKLAERYLYCITKAITPLASSQDISQINDNIMQLLGLLGKCSLAKKLYFKQLKEDDLSLFSSIVRHWLDFIDDFPMIIDNLMKMKETIVNTVTRYLNSKIIFDNGSDLLYFLDELDFIQLICMSIAFLSKKIPSSFINDLTDLKNELKTILTKEKIMAVLHKSPKHIEINEICYEYLPESFWWRRWG